MSFPSPISPFDPDEQDGAKGCSGLTQQFCGVSHFVRDLRTRLRFGHLSRAPLRLLRFLISEDAAECDWIARPQDSWDRGLPHDVGSRHASLQALNDAIDVRALIFDHLPELKSARLLVYRESNAHARDLIIVGNVQRRQGSYRNVRSVAMRAKLIGFRFEMENGLLRHLPREEQFGFGD
jgi:hypothetical protein